MGAGRTELLECVAGRVPAAGGRVLLCGEDVTDLSIAQRIASGLALAPEDRQRDGLVQTLSVGQNLSLASIGAFIRKGLLSRSGASARWSARRSATCVSRPTGPRRRSARSPAAISRRS